MSKQERAEQECERRVRDQWYRREWDRICIERSKRDLQRLREEVERLRQERDRSDVFAADLDAERRT